MELKKMREMSEVELNAELVKMKKDLFNLRFQHVTGQLSLIHISKEMLPMQNERGAGDAFSAAVLDGASRGMTIEQLAAYGMKAAEITLECKAAVNSAMSRERMQSCE